jgi:uncharacterized protein YbjT (DUF2867 family)
MTRQADTARGKPLVLLTGATGYVGGRLAERIDLGRCRLRCLARRAEFLRERVPTGVEVVEGDALDRASLERALEGVHTAYYLIHSMGSRGDFRREDRLAARNFAAAARERGVTRIVYLGGLGDPGEALSAHLSSRHEVGEILRTSGAQVIELRASIVIGSGSLSFELVRALTERLPVMTTPRWVSVPAQPIAIDDLLSYLVGSLEIDVEGHQVYEVGGRDVVSYGDLIREYARQRGLRRLILPVPVLTPGLSARWLGLVTPVYARIGRKLIDSLRHPTVVRDPRAMDVFAIEPTGVREAIAAALRNEDREVAASRWSDALSSTGGTESWAGVRFGNRFVDSRSVRVAASAGRVFDVVSRIGGDNGWFHADWLWRVRGWIDLLAGGVGMRRGRNDARRLRAGDVVDCWRVESVVEGRTILLASEMKTPGRAWLRFDVEEDAGRTTLRQTAIFDPVGVLGLAYWHALWAVHQFVFAGMIHAIAVASVRSGGEEDRGRRPTTFPLRAEDRE